MTIQFDHPVLSSCRNSVVSPRFDTIPVLKAALMLSLASGAVIAGMASALAAGETFVWDGKGNGTGFAQENNWTDITVRGPVLMFDENGYELHEWLPVFDDEGNPVYAWHQLFDENDQPVLDDEGKEVWFQGEQELEAGPLLYEEGDVLLPGPPDGEQNMLLLSGTPNISSSGRHVHDVDLLGGEFLIRTGTVAVIPGDFFVDGTLTIDDTGILTVRGDDSRGQNVLTAREAAIDGGTARGTGILRVTGENPHTHESEPGIGMTQSGGLVTELTVETPFYEMSGGTLSALVNFKTLFALSGTGEVTADAVLSGASSSTMTQSGGTMNGTVAGIDTYTQSGGLMSGTITVADYNLTNASALSTGGKITASKVFNLGPEGGTATLDAWLSGTGDLVKTGDSTVVLTNAANDFSGTVAITAGTLEVVNDALTDGATVTIGPDAILKLTVDSDTLYMGDMTGSNGDLVKAGSAAATLGGNITLGDLFIDAGRLNIGTGTTTNEAIFDSATVGAGSTLYIANNATLTIRVPQHLVNNGTLINDGTVHDDLDNTGTFANNEKYNADVATNTGTIDNNEPGKWTGDIESNAGKISNAIGATWDGAVEGNTGNITNNGTWLNGTVTNGEAGVNPGLNLTKVIYNDYTATWDGDIAENYSWILNAGGTWTGDVLSNHREIWNDNRYGEIGIGYWIGDVKANDGSIFNGGGGNWTGNVLSNSGSIKNDAPAEWTGYIAANDGMIENRGLWTGEVQGNSGKIFNETSWSGDVLTNAGRIFNYSSGTWTGNVLANTGTISTTSTWAGDITSSGLLKASGTISGAIDTSGGTLELTGALTAGSVTFDQNSFFDVGVDAAGVSERMTVIGNADLAGTVRISAASVQANADFATPYTILSADSISAGSDFDGVTTDLAFLTPDVSVNGTQVILSLARNDVGFASAGVSQNQQAAAAAVTPLGIGNPIYDAFLWLTAAQAQDALDQLSGESNAAAGTWAIQSANLVGNLATSRIDQAFGALGDSADSASNYAGEGLLPASATDDNGLWGQVYGARGFVDAGNGTAASDSYSGGVAGGLDGMLGDWRLGILMHIGTTGTDVGALNSSTTSTDYGLGVYGGTQWGATQFSIGGIATLHDTRGQREVGIPGFADTLSADYLSATTQAFAELSHEFDFGAFSVTPFGSVAQVSHSTQAYTETGGAAALTTAADRIDATFATIGAGIDRQFVVDDDKLLTASASLGWRHAFADQSAITNAFSTGTSFSVVGAPVASDLVVLEAGVTLDISATANFDLTYDGQIGDGAQTHAIKAIYSNGF